MESLTRRSPNTASSDNENTFTELSCERAAVYGLLARLCREEIDRATFDELKRFQNQSPRNDDAIGRGLELIGSYVNAENECENDRLTALAVDFARVFIGHGTDGHSAAYPYESVYTSDKRLIMQQARKDVAGIYASYGVKTRSSWGEGEDHLATELEFMQILCLKTDGSAEAFIKQKDFLDAHLMNWVPLMANDIRRFARTDFYRGFAYMLEGFLFLDDEFLADAAAA